MLNRSSHGNRSGRVSTMVEYPFLTIWRSCKVAVESAERAGRDASPMSTKSIDLQLKENHGRTSRGFSNPAASSHADALLFRPVQSTTCHGGE